MNVTFEVVGGDQLIGEIAVEEQFDAAAVAEQVNKATDLIYERVREKLSGEVLQKISGRLYDSIQKEVVINEDEISGQVFSDGSVPYADILERGGDTRPHDIVAVNARALRFLAAGPRVGRGDIIFATVVHHPGSHIRPYAYIGSSFEEVMDQMQDLFTPAELGF